MPGVREPRCCRSIPWAPRMAYLDHGPYNFPGFLVELLSIPAGVQALELGGQAVMLPHKEGVHGRELRHLTGAGVP